MLYRNSTKQHKIITTLFCYCWMARATIKAAVLMFGHETTWAWFALLPLFLDWAVLVNLEELQELELFLLPCVWHSFLCCESLLLPLLLLSTTKAENQVKRWVLLDWIVLKSVSIFQLFSCKYQALLIRGNSFLVLDLGLDVLNAIRRLDLKRYMLSGQSLDKDLHL